MWGTQIGEIHAVVLRHQNVIESRTDQILLRLACTLHFLFLFCILENLLEFVLILTFCITLFFELIQNKTLRKELGLCHSRIFSKRCFWFPYEMLNLVLPKFLKHLMRECLDLVVFEIVFCLFNHPILLSHSKGIVKPGQVLINQEIFLGWAESILLHGLLASSL